MTPKEFEQQSCEHDEQAQDFNSAYHKALDNDRKQDALKLIAEVRDLPVIYKDYAILIAEKCLKEARLCSLFSSRVQYWEEMLYELKRL